MGRKLAREEAMKLLFQIDINNDDVDDVLKLYFQYKNLKPDEKSYVDNTITMALKNLDTIDGKISQYAYGWKLNRIAKVDLAVLRIAIYEIIYREDIPTEVSINEAIEISKKYSTEESSKFINGLLGSLVKGLNNKNV